MQNSRRLFVPGECAPGRGLEPLFAESKSAVLPIERPRNVPPRLLARFPGRWLGVGPWLASGSQSFERFSMGSLIKKRRKRMRKKKHKKMLRRTRHQRRK